MELDQLLETAKTLLKKLEDTFSQNLLTSSCAIHFYKEVLQIYKHCRYLDRILNSQYFENPELLEVISNIRQELKKERAAKLTRQVSEKYEANRSLVQEAASGVGSKTAGRTEVADRNEEVAPPAGKAATKSFENEVRGSLEAKGELCAVALNLSTQTKEVNTLTQTEDFPKCDVEVSTEEEVSGRAVDMPRWILGAFEKAVQLVPQELKEGPLQSEIEELRRQMAQVGVASAVVKCQEGTETWTTSELGDMAACDTAKDCDKSVQTESAPAAETAAGKTTCDKAVGTECPGRVLCQRACHLVAVQVVKVQSDLEEKWQTLKKEGKLRILEEEEDEEMDEVKDGLKSPDGKLDLNAVEGTVQTDTDKSQLKLDLPASPSDGDDAFLLKSPVTPQTPAEVKAKLEYNRHGRTALTI